MSDTKKHRMEFRLNDRELATLLSLARATCLTKSALIRELVESEARAWELADEDEEEVAM